MSTSASSLQLSDYKARYTSLLEALTGGVVGLRCIGVACHRAIAIHEAALCHMA